MKFFRKKKILFKLILTLCICLLLCPFVTNNTYVYADNKDEVKEHYKEHLGDDGQIKDYTNSHVDGNAYVFEFKDGCSVTVKGTDNQYKSTWNIKMGQSTSQGTYEVDGDLAGVNEKSSGSNSSDDEEWSPALTGGKLLTPIFDFLMSIGDAIMGILQKQIMGTSAVITIDSSANLFKMIAGIIGAIIAVGLVILLTGGIAAFVAGIGGAIGGFLTAAGTSGIVSVVLTAAMLGAGFKGYNIATSIFSAALLPDITVFPTYSISPEEIFEGRLLIFDVNFFNPKTLKVHLSSDKDDYSHDKNEADYDSKTDGKIYYYYYEGNDGKPVITSKQNTALQLSAVISSWYYAIRNFALVMMMLILIYLGIRMMISSVASEKSKYKKMLGDWVISMCLVFLLHYIMVFLVNINENIVELVDKATDKNTYAIALDKIDKKDRLVNEIVKSKNIELMQGLVDADNNVVYDSNGEKVGGEPVRFIWPTNLLGQIRMMAQMQDGSVEYLGYSIAFLALVFYTLFFAVTYLKRVIYMAFLTVIAPLVAMTYSIDKMADGRAQAFNMWFKEYMFNLLIQPVHLLLYMLLINMAFELAGQNIIYTLVAIGFMMPAEKLIRSMFGLDKAKTPGFLGGATGAALTMSALQSLDRFAGKGPGGKKLPGKGTNRNDDNDPDGIYSRGADSGHGGLRQLLRGGNNEENPPVNTVIAQQGNQSSSEQQNSDNQSVDNQINSPVIDSRINQVNPPQDEPTINQPENLPSQREEEDNSHQLDIVKFANRKRKDLVEWGKAYKRITGDNLRKNVFSKTAVKRAVKTAVPKTLKGGARFTGAALGAGIGLAAGITSGDPNTALKNVGLGMSAGHSIGTGVANGMSTASDNYKNARVEYEKERYGEDYDKYKKEQADKKFKKDDEARKLYANAFSKELREAAPGKERKQKLDTIMAEACKYRAEGVTDNEMIINAMKLDTRDKASRDSIAAAMIATKSKDLKAVKEYKKDYLDKYVNSTRSDNITKNAMKLAGFSLE